MIDLLYSISGVLSGLAVFGIFIKIDNSAVAQMFIASGIFAIAGALA